MSNLRPAGSELHFGIFTVKEAVETLVELRRSSVEAVELF